MKIALHGHMGRDEALAENLVNHGHELYIMGSWQNPGLVDKAKASGGQFQIVDNITDVEDVADFVQSVKPDMFLTNFDASLAAGAVDAVRRRVASGNMPDLLMPCPDQKAARVEWDKFFLRGLIDEIDPKYNPQNFMVETPDAALAAIAHFADSDKAVVIKPRNLTGGKGVKVMGKHFDTYDEAKEYAQQVLADPGQTGLEVQERLDGHEFTLQLFTDGTTLIKPPATYDYPYREDGDTGPGTGGMGTFSMQAGVQMPFLTDADYNEAVVLMERLLLKMKEKDINYKGVLYPTFFWTTQGLRIVEINARGGDPELMNIVDLVEDDVDMGEVLRLIALGELRPDSVRFKKLASAVVYLVAPEYGYGKGPMHEFEINPEAIEASGVRLRFAAAERVAGNRYRITATSRIVALSALAPTPWEARDKILTAIANGFSQPLALTYRQQVAEKAYIGALA